MDLLSQFEEQPSGEGGEELRGFLSGGGLGEELGGAHDEGLWALPGSPSELQVHESGLFKDMDSLTPDEQVKKYQTEMNRVKDWYNSQWPHKDPYLMARAKILTIDNDFRQKTAFSFDLRSEAQTTSLRQQGEPRGVSHRGQVLAKSLLDEHSVHSNGKLASFL